MKYEQYSTSNNINLSQTLLSNEKFLISVAYISLHYTTVTLVHVVNYTSSSLRCTIGHCRFAFSNNLLKTSFLILMCDMKTKYSRENIKYKCHIQRSTYYHQMVLITLYINISSSFLLMPFVLLYSSAVFFFFFRRTPGHFWGGPTTLINCHGSKYHLF